MKTTSTPAIANETDTTFQITGRRKASGAGIGIQPSAKDGHIEGDEERDIDQGRVADASPLWPATTISDDRSHDSDFRRNAADHLLNALASPQHRQRQSLQSGSSNHGVGQDSVPPGWDPMLPQIEKLMRQKHQDAELIKQLKLEKEEMVRMHTIETGALRQKFSMFQHQSPAVQQETKHTPTASQDSIEAGLQAERCAMEGAPHIQHQTVLRGTNPQAPSALAQSTPGLLEYDAQEAGTIAQQPILTIAGQNMRKRRKVTQHAGDIGSARLLTESPSLFGGSYLLQESTKLIATELGIPENAAANFRTMQAYIANLQSASRSIKPCRHQIIHRVKDDQSYWDQPKWIWNEMSSKITAAGNLPVVDLNLYLAKHPEVSFIVYRDYTSSDSEREAITGDNLQQGEVPNHCQEQVVTVAKELTMAMRRFLKAVHGSHFDQANDTITLEAPYISVYHYRGLALESFLGSLASNQRDKFRLFLDYVMSQYSQEWAIVDDLISRHKITSKRIAYLVKPGDILVKGELQKERAYLCRPWPQENSYTLPSKDATDPPKTAYSISVRVVYWNFDGGFSKQNSDQHLQVESSPESEVDIADLGFRPLRLMNPAVQERLRRRGERFWKCRKRCLISYHDDNSRESHSSADDRYMVDMAMYCELHKSNTDRGMAIELDPGCIDRDKPPEDGKYPGFIYLLPPTIKAFKLKSKKWLDLQVDRIGDVVWNDEAFKSLVIKDKTKQLIQALIGNHIEAEKATDLISGKGNGLVLLLHGGPGTGKTLTAESVAEVARRPLYPVTCGDIGTEPERVETYLESVFHIGKTWGCVVLLDEADVFLEERSFENLQRNALVSVFLRALEYYEGILILTSNRVGHFDEAFKSRIQLAVRYKPLDREQRTEIWKNFIRRLENLKEEDIDFADLKDHVSDLSRKDMNGREIRNAITTARQFVKWKRQQPNGGNCLLNYNMLNEDVLQPVAEFDEYLGELYGGNSSEQLARQEGKR